MPKESDQRSLMKAGLVRQPEDRLWSERGLLQSLHCYP
jgi:hypothetical protein